MKNALASLSGVALGAFFVLITGALSVQVIANEDGAAFDLSNTVVGIVAPKLPILPSLAIAALSCLVIALLAFPLRKPSVSMRRFFTIAFFLTVAAFVIWAFHLTSQRIDGGRPSAGVLEGISGWVEEGGRNSATHIVALLAVMTLWLKQSAAASLARETSPSSETDTRA